MLLTMSWSIENILALLTLVVTIPTTMIGIYAIIMRWKSRRRSTIGGMVPPCCRISPMQPVVLKYLNVATAGRLNRGRRVGQGWNLVPVPGHRRAQSFHPDVQLQGLADVDSAAEAGLMVHGYAMRMCSLYFCD
jgi:hypothetical protein